MARHFRVALCIAFVLAGPLCAGAARGDVVVLDNGDRLSGRVERKAGATLTLKTTYAGRLSIDWKRVVSITTDEPVRVMLKGSGRAFSSRLLAAGDRRVGFASGANRAALARVGYINPTAAETGAGTVYNGRVTLSSASAHGNTTNSRLYAQGEMTARAHAYRYTLGLRGERSSDSGQQTAFNWLGDASLDRFLDAKHFVYGRASAEHNRFSDLRLRSTLGGGYGFQFHESEYTKFSLRGGLDYVSVDREAGEGERYVAAGWGLKFSHQLQMFPVELFHEEDGFFSIKDMHKLTLHSRSGLRVPLADGLNASMQLNVDWNRSPAPGYKSTDTTLLIGLGYVW